MAQRATAKGLSDRTRSIIDSLFDSGCSEQITLAELLNDVAESDGLDTTQANDKFLIEVAKALRDHCDWFIREMKKK